MKKTLSLLLLPLLAFGLIANSFADEPPKLVPLETRLAAIEAHLNRIERLLQSNMSAPLPGQVQVSILGEVNAPGAYNVNPGTPVGTLVAMAGGFTRVASGVVSISQQRGRQIRVKVSDNPRAYRLRKGDIVTVGEAVF